MSTAGFVREAKSTASFNHPNIACGYGRNLKNDDGRR